MACPSTYCANCVGNSANPCGTKHRAPNSASYSFPALGDIPTVAYTNALKAALNQEISKRNSARSYGAATSTFTDVTNSNVLAKSNIAVLDDIKAKINALIANSKYKTGISRTKITNPVTAECKGCNNHVSYPTSGGDGLSSSAIGDVYTAGNKITKAHWTNLANKILALMRECLCNGDCGANTWCNCHNYCGCNYSDERLKNIHSTEVVSSIDEFNQIKSKEWNYLSDEEHSYYGPIAQDVRCVYPNAVREDEDGYLMLDQTSMVGILWSALNKSIDKISELEERISKLEQK